MLTAKEGEKDNGCIINTVMQVTDTPMQISVTVNKQNYTTEMIEKTGVFNVSILSEEAKFSVIAAEALAVLMTVLFLVIKRKSARLC